MKQRLITDSIRGPRSTVLKLECGHDRSIGGNKIEQSWGAGPAHMMKGFYYPCQDGHCGGWR